MNLLFTEKIKVVADRNVWSLEQAKGFIDGETARRRGKAPSKLTLIGIDEYSLGFRAGFFERRQSGAVHSVKLEGSASVAGFAESR